MIVFLEATEVGSWRRFHFGSGPTSANERDTNAKDEKVELCFHIVILVVYVLINRNLLFARPCLFSEALATENSFRLPCNMQLIYSYLLPLSVRENPTSSVRENPTKIEQ